MARMTVPAARIGNATKPQKSSGEAMGSESKIEQLLVVKPAFQGL
jgi:hypothetical protein